jgi:hypothetical protein
MIQTSFFPQPEKDEPVKIIQVDSPGFQPIKVEELLPEIDILPDTYIIYPNGGYHPFYGVSNTFPIYQLPVWPYIKRIKYSNPNLALNNRVDRPNHDNSQTNSFLGSNDYPHIVLERSSYRSAYSTREKKMRRARDVTNQRFHRLVALAYVPNPEKKKNVCHINDDRTNFLIHNLKWGTQSENIRGKIQKLPETKKQKYLNMVDKGYIKG